MNSRMVGIALGVSFFVVPAFADDTVKIGYIDPLSGGGASIGEVGLKTFQYLADELNANGGLNGKKVEIVGLDNKTNPQESLIQAQKAADQGIRIITQGNGSSVAAALSDWVTKYNDRNPGKEIIYLNYAAVDPVLTNDKCSYWHFRWDANSDIKMAALTNFMKDRPNIKKVYLINQDYSFGQSVRKQARAMLNEKRPDIEIVGDEVHPLLKVTDFSPYIAKIKASGADSVITGNWGQDIALLAEGGRRRRSANRLVHVLCRRRRRAHGDQADRPRAPRFRRSPKACRIRPRKPRRIGKPTSGRKRASRSSILARSTKCGCWRRPPLKPSRMTQRPSPPQLEGMTIEAFDGGEATMRKDDHQFFQDMYISSFGPLDPGAKFDEEGTGWGWKLVGIVKANDTVLPTTCKMERP